ncbi:hypothetical protein [Actinomycetospora soli]|uniref:hypothetical protein n=1 Tax=Actinomycetospora soli TaxID=2893887 RepID=UPI001E539569|nr:hypothetical protein [Actinomycetospora soli]MCD2191539.1 hypothetical protein [Actinomycetospora soli]
MEAALANSRVAPRWPAVIAAALTLATAVTFDVLGEAEAVHTLWVGLAALAVASARLLRWGQQHRVLVAALSALVVGQPAVHLADEAWHQQVVALGEGQHQATHVVLLVIHLGIAGLVAAGVSVSDILLLALAETLTATVRVLASLLPLPVRHRAPRACVVTLGPVGELSDWVDYAVRRGPPRVAIAGD